jgi:sulfite exporter TauE/SafE
MSSTINHVIDMKASRLLAYAVAGVIVGLLVENKALTTTQDVKDTAHKWKSKLSRKLRRPAR